jgi:mannose-6-phosphate isomerase-like protein (cupin superfamily)
MLDRRKLLKLGLGADAAHSLTVLEGTVKVQAGKNLLTLEKGDFISIPADMPHKYWSITGKASFISMDAPCYDPRKTVVLE